MSAFWILAPAVVAAVVVWHLRRRAAARRAACGEQFAALLARRRPELSLGQADASRWLLRRGATELAAVDPAALTRAAAGDEEGRRRLFLAVADAAAGGPRPLAGPFDLKVHGARVLPRLADGGLRLLRLEPAVRFVAADAAGLETLYVVNGDSRPAYLTEEHLRDAGIDARDLHGVALAVLRQRFDDSQVRAALGDRRAVAVEPPDGCGASRLLLLPEALGAGERLLAAAPSPALLLVAAERAALDEALAARGEADGPPVPGVFLATHAGLRREE